MESPNVPIAKISVTDHPTASCFQPVSNVAANIKQIHVHWIKKRKMGKFQRKNYVASIAWVNKARQQYISNQRSRKGDSPRIINQKQFRPAPELNNTNFPFLHQNHNQPAWQHTQSRIGQQSSTNAN